MIEAWLAYKTLWSIVLFLTFGMVQPYAPVPTFDSPELAAAYLAERFIYTGDPLKGAVDFTVSPGTLQGAMQMGPDHVKRLPLDCDDVGAWAFVAVRNMGGTPTLYTLEDGSGRFGHHVVCAYTWRGQMGAIDTNGHRLLPDTAPATVCAEFTRVYAARGYRYVAAVATPCPF